MLFRSRALAKLEALEARLDRIEQALSGLETADGLRRELETQREHMDALAQQALHVVELLAEARAEIRRLRGSS